jgi:hypothetical protein
MLWTNSIEMCPSSNIVFYRYDIAVSSGAAVRKLGRVIRLLLEAHKLAEFRLDMVIDFKLTLISREIGQGRDGFRNPVPL